MTTFDNRENAFENQFAHDAEVQFKVAARRDKLIGLWAAGLLGHVGEAVDSYAKSVILADLEEPGDADVIRKLVADLDGLVSEADIQAQLELLEAEARRQITDAL